jgi:signal transduction histidine kinase/PAS domain-containing protein
VDPDVLQSKVAAFAELHRAPEELLRHAVHQREADRAERQRALQQLELRSLRRQQAASDRYRRLVDGVSHAVVWSLDRSSLACTLVSRSAEALLGRTAEAWLREPTSWRELGPEEDRARVVEAVRAAGAGTAAPPLDHGLTHADGSVGRFRTELRLVPGDEEGPPELLAFSVDVTEVRLAEEALSLLARAGAELSASLDLDDIVDRAAALPVPSLADACEVSVEVAERTVRSVTGRPAALPGHGGPGGPPARLELALHARGLRLGTLRLARRAGAFAPQAAQLAAELAHRVGQALENALLYGEAQEAVRLRDEFISVASHELRTPLTALTLQARLLCRPGAGVAALDPGVARRAQSIARQVERMSRLVFNLLDVTRLRVNRLELAREACDLSALAEEVAGRFTDELAVAGRRLAVAAPGPLGPGPAGAGGGEPRPQRDPLRRRGPGGGDAPGRARRGHAGRARSQPRHRRGGSRPHLRPLRARTERAGRGRARAGALCGPRIVEAHGGRIAVESQPGDGAIFTVALPRDEQDVESLTGPAPAAAPSRGGDAASPSPAGP